MKIDQNRQIKVKVAMVRKMMLIYKIQILKSQYQYLLTDYFDDSDSN